jgi:hypothetical protein
MTPIEMQELARQLLKTADLLLKQSGAVEATSEQFTITNEWIAKNRSKRGGWSAKQLLAIGITWPPTHGWRSRVTGQKITQNAKAQFESFAGPERPPEPETATPTKFRELLKEATTTTTAPAKPNACSCQVLPWEHCKHTPRAGLHLD